MLSISPDILKQFDAVLEKKAVPFSPNPDREREAQRLLIDHLRK
jgi:hypothetical protein